MKKAKTTTTTTNATRRRPPGVPAEVGISPSGDAVALTSARPSMVRRGREEVIEEATALVRKGLLEADDDALLSGLGRIDALVHLHFGVDRGKALRARPHNARLVPDAGEAVATTVRGFPIEGPVMNVDADALSDDVQQLGRLGRAQRRYQLGLAPVEANAVALEVAIDETVRTSYARVEPIAESNAALKLSLAPAQLLIKGSARQGVATRRQNERLVTATTERVLKNSRREPTATTPGPSVVVSAQPVSTTTSAPVEPAPVPRSRARKR